MAQRLYASPDHAIAGHGGTASLTGAIRQPRGNRRRCAPCPWGSTAGGMAAWPTPSRKYPFSRRWEPSRASPVGSSCSEPPHGQGLAPRLFGQDSLNGLVRVRDLAGRERPTTSCHAGARCSARRPTLLASKPAPPRAAWDGPLTRQGSGEARGRRHRSGDKRPSRQGSGSSPQPFCRKASGLDRFCHTLPTPVATWSISRILSRAIISLERRSPGVSSGQPGRSAGRFMPPLFGLAAGGVCLAGRLPGRRCALAAPFHPYRQAPAVSFLLHFPWGRPRRALPGTLPYAVRTFLRRKRPRSPDQVACGA